MLAADSVITEPATWDASAWIAAVAALIALGALVTAGLARKDSHQSATATTSAAGSAERSATAAERSAMTGEAAVRASQKSADAAERSATSGETSAAAAQRSATAAEDANEMVRREAEQREQERQDAAGPQFVPEETVVSRDLTARIVMRVVGGPGEMRIVVRPAGVPWCSGISSGGAPVGVTIEYPPMEPGDDVTLTAHLTVQPWQGHRRIILPLSVAVSTRDESEWWERRVPVPLLPPVRPTRVW